MDLTDADGRAALTRLRLRFGDRAGPWWQTLPALLEDLCTRWDLTLGRPVGSGGTSLVIRCQAGGRPAMLKLTSDPALATAEAAALRAWAPSGRVPAVWAQDSTRGALLLEAIATEIPLSDQSGHPDHLSHPVRAGLDEIAVLIAALHSAVATPAVGTVVASAEPLAARVEFIFCHWAGRWRAHPGPIPVKRLLGGLDLARALAADPPAGEPAVLLHGDLHPGNVLDGGPARGLVAIDPRPCRGEAAFDTVDWVFWNAPPPDWEPRARHLAGRLALDAARVWAWCAAFAPILAASRARRGAGAGEVAALLRLAP